MLLFLCKAPSESATREYRYGEFFSSSIFELYIPNSTRVDLPFNIYKNVAILCTRAPLFFSLDQKKNRRKNGAKTERVRDWLFSPAACLSMPVVTPKVTRGPREDARGDVTARHRGKEKKEQERVSWLIGPFKWLWTPVKERARAFLYIYTLARTREIDPSSVCHTRG